MSSLVPKHIINNKQTETPLDNNRKYPQGAESPQIGSLDNLRKFFTVYFASEKDEVWQNGFENEWEQEIFLALARFLKILTIKEITSKQVNLNFVSRRSSPKPKKKLKMF